MSGWGEQIVGGIYRMSNLTEPSGELRDSLIRGMTRARVPRSLAGDSAVTAGGQGLLDVPGHAFGPEPPPVDQHHDGGQARTVNTTHTESAFLRGWKRSPARQPGERGIGVMRTLKGLGHYCNVHLG